MFVEFYLILPIQFNKSEGFLLQEAERYVDEGLCWEIGEVDGEQVLIRTTNKDKR